MSEATSSVQRQSFQCDIDRLFYFSFKPSVFSGQKCLHCPQRNDFSPSDVSGQQSLDLRSPSVLCHLFLVREVVLSLRRAKCAVLAAMNSVNYITLLMPGCICP